MTIQSVKNTLDGGVFLVTLDDGTTLNVPNNTANRHRQELQAWVDGGGVIAPADPAPSKPTDADRAEASIRSNPGDLAVWRAISGNDALTENAAVALARAKLP